MVDVASFQPIARMLVLPLACSLGYVTLTVDSADCGTALLVCTNCANEALAAGAGAAGSAGAGAGGAGVGAGGAGVGGTGTTVGGATGVGAALASSTRTQSPS